MLLWSLPARWAVADVQVTVEPSTAVQTLVGVGERDACGGGDMSALCMILAKDRRRSRVWRWRLRRLAAGAVVVSAAASPVAPAAATPACLPASAPACPPDAAGWVAAGGAGGAVACAVPRPQPLLPRGGRDGRIAAEGAVRPGGRQSVARVEAASLAAVAAARERCGERGRGAGGRWWEPGGDGRRQGRLRWRGRRGGARNFCLCCGF